jgi:C4-dicarboxylate-specific signal transduction histidine kinase
VPELTQTIRDIIDDDTRAGAVILNLRALFKDDKKTQNLDVNEIVRDVLALMKSLLVQRGIHTELQLVSAPVWVQGNRVQLQQVVLNLILNAAEAMKENGAFPRTLTIKTYRDDSYATMSIQDSGPGIQEGIRDRMFNAFFTTKTEGLGLGLSICRSIVATHGGRLRAGNVKPRGAIFFVTLPLAQEGAQWLGKKVRPSTS